jgi:hypothetical protein
MVAHHLTPACQPNIAGPPIQHIHTSNPNPLPSPFFRLLASSVPRRSARGPWGGTTVAVGRNWEAAAAVGGGGFGGGHTPLPWGASAQPGDGKAPPSQSGQRVRARTGGVAAGKCCRRGCGSANAADVGRDHEAPGRDFVSPFFCDLCVSGYAIRFFVMKFLTFTHSICFFSCLAGHRWRAMCQEAGTVC